MKKHKFFKSSLIYTGLFIVFISYIIYIFKKNGKGFIWESDALHQHIMTLHYFRNMLVEFIKTGEFSTFTWYIGNGMNLFGNLGYYILGDIFSYVSILVPASKIELVYSVLIFVRLYFVGISFLYFCKYRNMNPLSSIIGALMYTFCTFAILSAVRHPYFINEMILFPLVMVGIEKIIIENRNIFYTIMITLLFIVNFYFAYMIAIVVALYGIILTIYTYKKQGIKRIIKKLLQILWYSLIGIMISAIILLPVALEFLNSERSGTGSIQPYSIDYYRNFVTSLLDINIPGYWLCLGVQSIVLITLPIFIKRRKENYPMFLLMVLLLFPLLISNLGSFFCGFSYPNNRWIFVLSFLFSFISTIFINDGMKIDKKDLNSIILFLIIYLFISFIFEINITLHIAMQIVIAIILLLIVLNKEEIQKKLKRKNLYHILLVFVFSIGVLSSIYYFYDVGEEHYGYTSQFVDSDKLNERIDTANYTISDFNKAIEYIKKKDKKFYNISKYPFSSQNISIIKKYKSAGSYYSITPHYYKDISMDLQNIQYSVSEGIGEFDYRTKISTLLGTKYYMIAAGRNIVPYGYKKIKDYVGETDIYVNEYHLPFAVLYDNYITNEEYKKMTPLERESSLLKTTVLQDNSRVIKNDIQHNETVHEDIRKNDVQSIDYQMIDYNRIVQNNKIVVTDIDKSALQLQIGNVKNSEIYLYIEDMQYIPYSKGEWIKSELKKEDTKIDKAAIEEGYRWYQPNYSYTISVRLRDRFNSKNVRDFKTSPYYFENNQKLFNLGYYDEVSGTITIKLSKVGTYHFSSIQVFAVSMEDYEEDINALRKSNFEVTSYGNGYMNGKVNAEKDGVLQFSTIYNKGWKVYVDNKEVETFISNNYFLGIEVTQGEHIIYMKYTVPYLKEGMIISLVGIILLIGSITLGKGIMKRKEQGK